MICIYVRVPDSPIFTDIIEFFFLRSVRKGRRWGLLLERERWCFDLIYFVRDWCRVSKLKIPSR